MYEEAVEVAGKATLRDANAVNYSVLTWKCLTIFEIMLLIRQSSQLSALLSSYLANSCLLPRRRTAPQDHDNDIFV